MDKSLKWISATNPKIKYSGAFVPNQNAMLFSYSGCNINFKVNSKSLILYLNDYSEFNQSNFIRVEINTKDTVIQLFKEVKKYDLSNLTQVGENKVQIFKLTESSVGKIEFEGLKVDKQSNLLEIDLPTTKIVWIGNSITCGYGNEVSILAPPKGNPNTGFHSKNENNYKAWGSVASRLCEAQAIQLGYSGKGLYRNNDGSKDLLIADFIQKAVPLEDIDIIPSTVFAPIYVLHVGTNDFGYEGSNPTNKVDSGLFINGLHAVFNVIKKWNPNAHIVVVSSNAVSNFYPVNGANRFKQYLKIGLNDYMTDNLKFHFLELNLQTEPYGENWHPSAIEHQKMANQIVPLLKDIMLKL